MVQGEQCWTVLVPSTMELTRSRVYQAYEVNDSELAAAFRAIDISLEAFSTRSNVDPRSLPWTSLRVLLTESIYGGKLGESEVSGILELSSATKTDLHDSTRRPTV